MILSLVYTCGDKYNSDVTPHALSQTKRKEKSSTKVLPLVWFRTILEQTSGCTFILDFWQIHVFVCSTDEFVKIFLVYDITFELHLIKDPRYSESQLFLDWISWFNKSFTFRYVKNILFHVQLTPKFIINILYNVWLHGFA